MSQTTAMAWLPLLGNLQAEDPQMTSYYLEGMTDLAKRPLFCSMTLIPVVAGTAEYALPEPASAPWGVRILAVFLDDVMLSLTTRKCLEAISPDWRDHRGMPIAFTTSEQEPRAFRVYPTPQDASAAQSFILGAPFGVEYPAGTLCVLHTDYRTELPPWMDLPIAFAVLWREFSRDSDHKDAMFAQACKTLGDLAYGMVS